MKRPHLTYVMLLTVATIVMAESLSIKRVSAITFTVTTTTDNGNNAIPTPGSLRKAILDSNGGIFIDTIKFAIPGAGVHTITPPAPLPNITDPVTIDGWSQGGAGYTGPPLIELNGASAGASNGLTITAGNSTVQGLVINRFSGDGIRLQTNGGSTIQGNYIGTNSAGTAALGNTADGVTIFASVSNTVGGTTATPGTAAGNVISGNGVDGVQLFLLGATGNSVLGNIIGLNAAGTVALGNGLDGVRLSNDTDSNTIGGTTTTARNVISGNGGQGVGLEFNNHNNVIKANFIGTNAAGTAALGNSQGGVLLLSNCSSNTIGGSTAAERNVISGNTQEGVEINGSTGNFVWGNYIGTDATGTVDLGNSTDGVLIDSGVSNFIGGTTAGTGNAISGNNTNGIEIINTASTLATAVRVQGNIIGLNAGGNAVLGNTLDGVHIDNSPNVQLGGSVAGAKNTISGNNGHGILILGASTAAIVQGNFIGADINGVIDLGNTLDGIRTFGATSMIGGAGSARNIISGNGMHGISLLSPTTPGGVVQNNIIGADVTGTPPLGNGLTGVLISSSGNTIGGAVGLGNIIAFNGDDGVRVQLGVGNGIFANSIFSNGTTTAHLGIDLGLDGVTPNDPLDQDSGANNLQNFPVLALVASNGVTTTILGSLDSVPNHTYTIEFFSNPSCDASGSGEGKVYVGTITVTTPVDNNPVSFSITMTTAVTPGQFVTATATDNATNDTSEFCACRQVTAGSPTEISITSATATGFDGGVLIEWRTGMEVNNLGFNIYCDDGGRLSRVNPELVAGSALRIGSDIALQSGFSYQWRDNTTRAKTSSYWIEDRDISGKSAWHGPIFANAAPGTETPAQSSKTLADLMATRDSSFPVEARAKIPTPTSAGLRTQSTIASSYAIKIGVEHEGWYRLTQPELLAAGLDPTIDPRNLQMFVDGRQSPLLVNGEADGRLDSNDSVEFYGTGVDSAFTDLRIYWLIAANQHGLRVSNLRSEAKPAPGGSFPFTIQRRDRILYFSGLRNGEKENFFGPVVGIQPVEQPLIVRRLDQSNGQPVILTISLQGVTNLPHVVTAQLNGFYVGQIVFQSQELKEANFSVPQALVRDGQNQVSLLSQGGPADISIVDYVQLRYRHVLTADDDSLRFSVSAQQAITIDGFSGNAIEVFDVTEPFSVQQLTGEIVKEEQGGYAVSLNVPGTGERTLLALTTNRAQHAAKLAADNPSSWRNPSRGADLVIITTRNLSDAALPLKKIREDEGLSVAIVDVEDIFDEFSFGQKTPQAIRDFLLFAKNKWKKPIRYALLFGDASFDPKNYLGLGNADLVPTKLVDTLFMETASDDWLADFNSDGVADLAVGRLPARDAVEAQLMTDKITSYQRTRPADEALLVSDVNDGYDFEAASDSLVALVPGYLRVTRINRGQLGDQAARTALIDAINRGERIVNYIGHGSVDLWRGGVFNSTDASKLENRERLPVFVAMNCLNGYFQDPALDSLAEALLKSPAGGAVAVWASSAITFPDGQGPMNQEFYRQVFAIPNARLGDAAVRAKAATFDLDARRTWILLGDPTMRMR